MKWHERIAAEMNIKHSDTMSVIRWGKKAKKKTRKRERRIAKNRLRSIE